ncbi:MAG: hypothetical protein U9R06_01670 [Patescibacteria group bacterium]|nr:hypothetical protein [Patescibacteria group bacterium]
MGIKKNFLDLTAASVAIIGAITFYFIIKWDEGNASRKFFMAIGVSAIIIIIYLLLNLFSG